MKFAKILCPTDFSRGAEQALRVAKRIARETNAELVIAHAWHTPPTDIEGAYGFGNPEEHEAEAKHDLEEVDVKGAKRKLLHGTPWREIVSLLEKEHFDLCVIGSRGRTGIERVLLGSVAEKVVRHAPCSVMAVRADGEDDVKPFMHALVPTDFSDSAKHALACAATIVPEKGLITLLHVLEVPASLSGIVPDEIGRDLDRKVTQSLKKELERVEPAARSETIHRVGYPGAETLAAIDHDKTIDLVVIGANGRSGIKRAIVGTVAEKTVRHARCPVLVTRKR
jgi:nucleotide-binding universal stress UspA family protein